MQLKFLKSKFETNNFPQNLTKISLRHLGQNLDKQKKHTEKIGQKLKARNSILKKLTGTTWGAHQTSLKTSALALCFSTTENCAPVWERSKHTKKIDTQLITTMRIVSGALKAIPTIWLPIMTAIVFPHLPRQTYPKRSPTIRKSS